MDHKFLLAIVWVLGVAVVASVAYLVWDLLKWMAGICAAVLRMSAPYLGAGYAMNTWARAKSR